MTYSISQLNCSLQQAIHIFQFFCLNGQNKELYLGVESICQTAKLFRSEVALCDICLSFIQVNTELIAEHLKLFDMNNIRSHINRNLDLQCGRRER